MEMKTLGRTGFKVTRLVFGAMEMKKIDRKTAGGLFNTALDMGINYIDTAPEYEHSEEFIGDTVSHRRNDYYLATKCGDYLGGNGPNPISSNILFSREVFTSNIERSLRLLKTDHIDLMQMHGLMPEYLPGGEQDELMELLADLKEQGKIGAIGATFRNGRKGEDLYPGAYGYLCADFFLQWKAIDSIQVPYGGMTRTNEIAISRLAKAGFGVMARGVMRKYFDLYDQQFEASGVSDLFEEGEDRSDFLLRFALSHPYLTAVVTGTSNIEHLKRNIYSANKGPLSEETYQEAKRRLNSVGMTPMP